MEFRNHMDVQLIDHMGDEQSIVRAARVSTLGTKAEATEAEGLVRFLVREGHLVPLESCVLTFRFEVPIFVSRQIVKHRTSSISEESGRYKELEPVFYVPAPDRPVKQVGKTGNYEFVESDKLNDLVTKHLTHNTMDSWGHYQTLLGAGVAKEVARTVLPVNTYSTMYMTMNLRNALHFAGLRSTKGTGHPQHEIAEVGDKVYGILKNLYPTVVDEWEKNMW